MVTMPKLLLAKLVDKVMPFRCIGEGKVSDFISATGHLPEKYQGQV